MAGNTCLEVLLEGWMKGFGVQKTVLFFVFKHSFICIRKMRNWGQSWHRCTEDQGVYSRSTLPIQWVKASICIGFSSCIVKSVWLQGATLSPCSVASLSSREGDSGSFPSPWNCTTASKMCLPIHSLEKPSWRVESNGGGFTHIWE